jgi:outer membrane protein assembly factor BamA
MKNGEVANGIKFEKGLHELAKRYGKTGHLDAAFDAQPDFDETAKRVTFKIAVKEGPQYRMGKLTVKGISVPDSRPFEEKWKLKRGDVFDTSYSTRYLRDEVRDEVRGVFAAWQAQGKRPPEIGVEFTSNPETLTADVIIEFKDQR